MKAKEAQAVPIEIFVNMQQFQPCQDFQKIGTLGWNCSNDCGILVVLQLFWMHSRFHTQFHAKSGVP